ncbi:hypothetical protein CKO09_02555 [Chromatium weissei]|nr:hypothetical protein [Chromatium weissei]
MDALQIERLREHLQSFNFAELFIEELGWSQIQGQQSYSIFVRNQTWNLTAIAELSGAVVFIIDGLPAPEIRLEIHNKILEQVHENLLIFIDQSTRIASCLWLWIKRKGKQHIPYEHRYDKNQSGDLFLSKLSNLYVDINEMDEEGWFPLGNLTEQIKKAFDVERVTKKFFAEYGDQHEAFQQAIQGMNSEKEHRWLASVLIHRLIFIWFLQRKHFLDGGNGNYLSDKLIASQQRGENQFYTEFLQALFFEGFAKPIRLRSTATCELIGDICFLNGGLFLPHHLEKIYGNSIQIPDAAFVKLFTFFQSYSWHLDDTPGGDDRKINPDVLGYIFEKYVNQKAFGAYYTRPQMTEYLCERTIHRVIVERIYHYEGLNTPRPHEGLRDLIGRLNAPQCLYLLNELPKLKLLDPACGSGAFLIAALKTLYDVYYFTIAHAKTLKNIELKNKLQAWDAAHKSLEYSIKRTIITNNLFGVEIVAEAVEIAKLRLFLALVATAESVAQLEPLPNIDFNIVTGNSLIGLMHVDAEEFENKSGVLALNRSYREIVDEKNRFLKEYRDTVAGFNGVNLSQIKQKIEDNQANAQPILNELLLTKIGQLGIRFEQASWDAAKNKMGKPIKRLLEANDVASLKPFHWGFEFNEVLEAGGFDAIITNPPWEVVKPNAKEFFQEHSELVTKNKMTIKEFEKAQSQLLADAEIRNEWLAYSSSFPHQSAWFRAAPQFKFQSAVVNGKKTGSDINLYKLFTEQCVNLLRSGGACGIVIPSGIYTDLGAKGLRDLLFNQTQITGLFCFENRKGIFEDVDSRFKFVVLTFEKGGATTQFPVAFMRHHLAELAVFPNATSLQLSVELIRKLSPDSHSIMEFKSATDVQIAQKLLKFPLLGETIKGTWNLRLTNEFHMTNDSYLFKTEPSAERLPLYEGKMIHQFEFQLAKPRYWIEKNEAENILRTARIRSLTQKLKKIAVDNAILEALIQFEGIPLDFHCYRFGFRDIARNTDERTMICTVLSPHVFAGNTLNLLQPYIFEVNEKGWTYQLSLDYFELLFVVACFDSFVVDWLLRQKITSHLNMFYVYQVPIPRLTAADSAFMPIVNRAARLICITPEFDALAKAVGLTSHCDGVTDSVKRAQLRAELDGLIAHLYGLTDEEFAHILATFPLVACDIRTAALNAYQTFDNESTT